MFIGSILDLSYTYLPFPFNLTYYTYPIYSTYFTYLIYPTYPTSPTPSPYIRIIYTYTSY